MTMKNIDTITRTLASVESANSPIFLEVVTSPKMNKRGNEYYGRVTKHTAYLGVSFGNYADEVNARRVDEGKTADFVAQASIYTPVNKYISERNGQYYLRMLIDKNASTSAIYYLDDRPATADEVQGIKSFFPKKAPSAKQNLDNEVQVRMIKVENLVAVGTENHTVAL